MTAGESGGTCRLCGSTQRVRFELLRYRAERGFRYLNGPRCVDRVGCQVRVETSGREWPIVDPRPVKEPSKP